MKTIGFGGTFYTLWDVESERIDISEGAHFNKVTCTYYKNLSKNLEDAIEKAGTKNLDESLKGKRRSFEYKTPIVLEPKIMTDIERLYRIILVNDRENFVEGVRQEAFARALELGYLTKIYGCFDYNRYEDGQLIKVDSAYKWNTELRTEQVWNSDTLSLCFIGII